MGIYKVTAPKPVLDVEPGDILEHDFAPADEADLVAAGRIEIVPRPYRVIGTSRVCDTDPGGTFAHAFTAGAEQALLAGGHLERVNTARPKAKAAKAAEPEATTDEKEK